MECTTLLLNGRFSNGIGGARSNVLAIVLSKLQPVESAIAILPLSSLYLIALPLDCNVPSMLCSHVVLKEHKGGQMA